MFVNTIYASPSNILMQAIFCNKRMYDKRFFKVVIFSNFKFSKILTNAMLEVTVMNIQIAQTHMHHSVVYAMKVSLETE